MNRAEALPPPRVTDDASEAMLDRIGWRVVLEAVDKRHGDAALGAEVKRIAAVWWAVHDTPNPADHEVSEIVARTAGGEDFEFVVLELGRRRQREEN